MQVYSLVSEQMHVEISDLGARIISWHVNIGDQKRSIVLRYPTLEEYEHDVFYVGAVAGPFANRIRHGRVTTTNDKFQLTCNSGEHHLHGGLNGFEKQYWEVLTHTEDSITMRLCVDDNVDGYPGPCVFTVKYRLKGRALTLEMTGIGQQQTIMGPTGHSYFNLNGADSSLNGLSQWLETNATGMTPKDDDGLPTGAPVPIAQTPFDFSQAKRFAEVAHSGELDHNFVFQGKSQCTTLYSDSRDMALTVTSDYPAAQFYTGYYLGGAIAQHQGVCVEPHFGADAPNALPEQNGLIDANQRFEKYIRYEVSVL